jgi:hypothetical protein
MDTVNSIPGSKAAGAWSCISISPYSFVAGCLIKHKDRFIFTFLFQLSSNVSETCELSNHNFELG